MSWLSESWLGQAWEAVTDAGESIGEWAYDKWRDFKDSGGVGGSASNSIKLENVENAFFEGSKIDVVRDYKWHTGMVTDMPSQHIPRIILREYELANSNLWASITHTCAFSKVWGDNPYAALYTCRSTKHTFIYPYLTEDVWDAKMNWEEVEAGGNESPNDKGGSLLGAVKGAVGWIGKKIFGGINDVVNQFGNTAPAKFENTRQEWGGNEIADVTTKVYLINTNATPYAWVKNYRLIQYLIVVCLHDQMNTTKAVPPPIYTMYIPGMRYSPACVISSLKIRQIGSVMPYDILRHESKCMTQSKEAPSPILGASDFTPEGDTLYIPDAWEIEIGFKDLVVQSRQTHLYGMNTRRRDFQAITPPGTSTPIDPCVYSQTLRTGYEIGSVAGNALTHGMQSGAVYGSNQYILDANGNVIRDRDVALLTFDDTNRMFAVNKNDPPRFAVNTADPMFADDDEGF